MKISKEALLEYQRLFKLYKVERNSDEKEYIEMYKPDYYENGITSVEHPAFFEIGRLWEKRRAILDKPILETAKYKIGHTLKIPKNNSIATGVVSKIKTSDAGSGEILYGFTELNPPCPECNPYCLEKNVIKRIK